MTLISRVLKPGDRVRLVSPASTPSESHVDNVCRHLTELGLIVELGDHVFDEHGYLAGTDHARLSDFNRALENPDVRAVIATRGGKGAYRIADKLNVAAVRRDPKLIIGFSEITVLQLALYRQCQLPAVHGAPWDASFSVRSAESFFRTVLTTEPSVITVQASEATADLTTRGQAKGILVGGNQEMVATAAGWALPELKDKILLLEAVGLRLGQMDRQLTMLENSGALRGIKGVAVGQFTDCLADATTQGNWTAIDVLRDRLNLLQVPVLGGLPIGHGASPVAVPVGTMAHLDADAGVLVVEPAVK